MSEIMISLATGIAIGFGIIGWMAGIDLAARAAANWLHGDEDVPDLDDAAELRLRAGSQNMDLSRELSDVGPRG
jgi:hypothetical protein